MFWSLMTNFQPFNLERSVVTNASWVFFYLLIKILNDNNHCIALVKCCFSELGYSFYQIPTEKLLVLCFG